MIKLLKIVWLKLRLKIKGVGEVFETTVFAYNSTYIFESSEFLKVNLKTASNMSIWSTLCSLTGSADTAFINSILAHCSSSSSEKFSGNNTLV